VKLKIIRADNGFVVADYDDAPASHAYEPAIYVYEIDDPDDEAVAFVRLLADHFEDMFQSKWHGGLKIRIATDGREAENEKIIHPAFDALEELPEPQREPIRRALVLLLGYDPLGEDHERDPEDVE
jgi:hypothetical protein